MIAPKGPTNVKGLEDIVEDPRTSLDLLVVETARLYLEQIALLSDRIATFEKTLRQEAARAASTSRLLTMPGIGPVTAMAIETFAPPMEVFKRGRTAWLGLVPVQRSTGGKSGAHVEDGPARYPPAADHRCHGRGALGLPQRSARKLLAGSHAEAQATQAGRDRTGQQDGPGRLGHVDEGRELQGSGSCRRLTDRAGRQLPVRGRVRRSTNGKDKVISQNRT